MIAETLIFTPDEGSIGVTAKDGLILLAFRHNATVIGKRLTRQQAEQVAQYLTDCLATLPPDAARKEPLPPAPASLVRSPDRKRGS